MCPGLGLAEANGGHPIIDQPGILPRAHQFGVIDPAWEHRDAYRPAAVFEPRVETCSDVSRDFELNRSARLLLDDYRLGSNFTPSYNLTDLELNATATAQVAVDRQIEQLVDWTLCADDLACVPSSPVLRDRIITRVTH